MNLLLAMGIALAVSIAGNIWLIDSRGDIAAQLASSKEVGKMCSDSVGRLEDEAKADKKAATAAVAAARKESKGKQASGMTTLSKAPSNPASACASVDTLVDEWYQMRNTK